MRKKLWVALAGCVILGLGGCGSTASETTEKVQNQENASGNTEEEGEEDSKAQSWYGTWVATEARATDISTLSEEEFSGMVGDTVTYGADMVQSNEEKLKIEGYETMKDVYTPDSLKEDYKVDLSNWEEGVESISFGEVIANEDQEFFGDTFFVTDTGNVWIYREGVFFRTEKAE